MATQYFKGFSTTDSHLTRQRTFYDVELVKRDLINHFNTRVGERVMRPDWGCRIWDYLMEPFTATVRDIIIGEATRVCESDTRCKIVSVNAIEQSDGITVEITLDFLPMNVIETFAVEFERRESARWNGDY